MHPPAQQQCQIYGSSVRCINDGTHWVPWSKFATSPTTDDHADQVDFYSWECDGDHRFGDAA